MIIQEELKLLNKVFQELEGMLNFWIEKVFLMSGSFHFWVFLSDKI